MRKNVKGITLVALVITIILLLILAGITISSLTGSGLFENAKLAEQKSKGAQEKEEGILTDYENKIGEYIDSSRDTVTISKEEWEKLKNKSFVPDYSKYVTITSGEKNIGTYTYTAPSDGYIALVDGYASGKPMVEIYMDEHRITSFQKQVDSNIRFVNGMYPIKANQVFKYIIYSANFTSLLIEFYPCE